ncbi:MAG: GNAT family N-acetyltransferase [Anaerolineae bacterium]|nr:GNAT family N-acetyltransferase [Anaerolineae bacterium]
MKIRPFERTDADYEAAVAIHRRVWPREATTVEEWRYHDEKRNPDFMDERFVVEIDGRIVATAGYGQSEWAFDPDKYFIFASVDPDYRRRGIGTAFYNKACHDLSPHSPKIYVSGTDESQTQSIRLLEQLGFENTKRYPNSHLTVADFDPEPFAGAQAKAAAHGISIRTVADLKEQDDDWQQRLYELNWLIIRDVPFSTPPTKTTFETYVSGWIERPGVMLDGWFVAVDEATGDYVGMTSTWQVMGDDEKVITSITGVTRERRRQGIATALKLHGIEFARQYGARIIETQNEENNPMYDLNMALGFVSQPAWLDYEKRLTD